MELMKKIALAQINIDYDNFEKNISKSFILIQDAINNHCDVIVFPELWSSGFRLEHCTQFADQNEMLIKNLQNYSVDYDIEIIGSYISKVGNNFYNQFIDLQSNNDPFLYKKINLFPALDEPKYFTPGTQTMVFDSCLGRCGASICFDLRFNWIYEEEAKKGAGIFIIPAHWPLERIHHWDILLQSRAIENLSFMIGVNSVGQSGKHDFGGHSSVISPDGEVIFQANGSTEGLFLVEIDPSQVEKVRKKYTFLNKKVLD